MAELILDDEARSALWAQVAERIEAYLRAVASPETRVTPEQGVTARAVRETLRPLTFEQSFAPDEAVDFAVRMLTDAQVHTPHPRYFGLFNPASTSMGIAADALAAAFNPQLAAWSHNPFANEAERHVLRALGAHAFGYAEADIDGTFTSGGAEANHTALLTALTAAFPDFARHGVRGMTTAPRLYVSREAHHSWHKAARACGIGETAVCEVPTDNRLCLHVGALENLIEHDRATGCAPFLIAATAGTTNAGAIDPLPELAHLAAREKVWFHVDAAWGGAAGLVPELRPLLTGIERADSITFDAHKWLSVPMGAGIYLTRHRDILSRTFDVLTAYMPPAEEDTHDPYRHSLQWSRRFIGLKVLLSLMVAGWDGYAAALRHQTAMGDHLRAGLEAAGWRVVNHTPFPLVCFVDGQRDDADFLTAVAARVVLSGRAWVSTTRLGNDGAPALRACVTNYRTGREDIAALLDALADARNGL